MVFTHDIKVRWGDCDSARIAYTAKIPDFALSAIEAFWEHLIDLDWYRMNLDEEIGAPFVHLSVDFKKPITPRHILNCEVRLTKIGQSSVTFNVRGYQDDDLCFEGTFVEVLTNAAHLTTTGIPEQFRQRLEAAVEPE